jgi:hypothetical protein
VADPLAASPAPRSQGRRHAARRIQAPLCRIRCDCVLSPSAPPSSWSYGPCHCRGWAASGPPCGVQVAGHAVPFPVVDRQICCALTQTLSVLPASELRVACRGCAPAQAPPSPPAAYPTSSHAGEDQIWAARRWIRWWS